VNPYSIHSFSTYAPFATAFPEASMSKPTIIASQICPVVGGLVAPGVGCIPVGVAGVGGEMPVGLVTVG
jgi:hypothetical protein